MRVPSLARRLAFAAFVFVLFLRVCDRCLLLTPFACPDYHRCVGCEVVLSGIEEQVSRANLHKEQQLGLKQQIESEVSSQGRGS